MHVCYRYLKVWTLLSHICNELAHPNVSSGFCVFVLSALYIYADKLSPNIPYTEN
jgi:hypothetical protein